MESITEASCVADVLESNGLENNENALIVAYASEDGDMVEQHFGSSLGFYVYRITANSADLIASRSFNKELKDGNIETVSFKNKKFDKSILSLTKTENQIVINTDGFGSYVSNLNAIHHYQNQNF